MQRARSLFASLLLPRSVALYVATICASLAAAAVVTPVVDPDAWWVAAAGRSMLVRHEVPRTNAFSFIDGDRPWIMHEWLFGPLYAFGLARSGGAFLAVVALLVVLCASALVIRATVIPARHPAAGWGLALIALLFFSGRFLVARPTGVALLIPMALVLVAFASRFGAGRCLAAVVLQLVWVNAHGSFPLGVVLLVLAAIDEPRDRPWRVVSVAGAALVTLANPYGASLIAFVWGYFRGAEGIYREIHSNIVEFGTIADAWGSTVGPIEIVGLAILFGLAILALRRREHRLRGAFCLVLLAGAAMHVRHVELAGLVSVFLLSPFVDAAWSRRGGAATVAAPRACRVSLAVLAPAAALGVTLYAYLTSVRTADDWIARGRPLRALLASVPDAARLYAPFQQAGLALWYDAPRGVRVFYDSRNDCYSVKTYREFRELEAPSVIPLRRRAILDETRTDAALIQQDHPLVPILSASAGWALAGQADDWRLYLRRPLAAVPEHGQQVDRAEERTH